MQRFFGLYSILTLGCPAHRNLGSALDMLCDYNVAEQFVLMHRNYSILSFAL
jgi:hypothetical protein